MSEMKIINHHEKEIKMKKITSVILGLILVTAVFAQPGQGRGPKGDCQPGNRMEQRGMRGENRDEMMAFMLSDRLDLTTEQADRFFPRFREHQDKMEALREEVREVNKDIFDKIKDDEEISDSELSKALKNMQNLKDKQESEREKFIEGLDDILNNNQIAKLALAPKHFGKKGQKYRPQNRR